MVAFVLVAAAITYLLHRDIVTSFDVETYRSARQGGGLVLLCIALEQGHVLYRGVLYSGIKDLLTSIADALNQSRTAVGAIAVGWTRSPGVSAWNQNEQDHDCDHCCRQMLQSPHLLFLR